MMNEELTERRLEYEARDCLGRLGVELGDATDVAKVHVLWWESDGYPRAGHYVVGVVCEDLDDDAGEDALMENHPASRAEEIVCARLAELQELRGWEGWEISEINAW